MLKSVALFTKLASLAIAVAIAGCGGGEGETHASAGGGGGHAARPTAPPSTAYQPSSSGSGGGVSEGFGSVHSSHPRLGGTAGAMRAEEMRRIAAIERAHRPPGPERLTGVDEADQRTADFMEAARTRAISSTDADACERAWDQHVATTEAFHARRHDGLHDPISASDRTSYLATCRQQSAEMQQCGDPAYMTEHMDECEDVRERETRVAQRRLHPSEPTEPEDVDRDPLDSFDP